MSARESNVLFITLLFFLTIGETCHAQEKSKGYLDSLYDRLIASSTINPKEASPDNYVEIEKCGTPLRLEIKSNYSYYSAEQQSKINSIMSRPFTETSLVSPSGYFRIHYDASGTSAPAYDEALSAYDNAMLVAEAFDSAYSFEVNHLDFFTPPSDNGAGGDNLYDVYITNLPSYYGLTSPDSELGNNRVTSFINIDNNYVGSIYTTNGIYAMRVTAAHEFHHAIQFGYIYRESDIYFMEMTSTSMEEFVFDDVNDYYGYLPRYFNNTSRAFTRSNKGDGYDMAIWNIFLADTLGIDIIRKQWELMPSMNAVEAIQQSLNDKNTSFFDMMNLFGIWCYYTGYRAQEGKYFKEAASYPVVKPMSSVSFNSSSKSVSLNCPPLSNTYVTFISTDANPDSLTIALSNSNYKAALNTPGNTYSIEYTLFNYAADGATKLNNNYYCSYAPQNEYWSTAEMLPGNVVKDGYYLPDNISFAFPSPFIYDKNSFIYLPVKAVAYENTYLNVYSSDMNLVYSALMEIKNLYGQNLVQWNVKDNSGKELPSGVYIYALRTGDNNSSGKIVIIH